MTLRGGKGFVWDPQVGTAGAILAPPVAHLKQLGPARIEIRGEIVGYSADLVPPAEHYTEGNGFVRQLEQEEEQLDARILKVEDGTYILTYHEVWEVDDVSKVGAPNHADNHNLIALQAAPGDGAIVS